MNEQNFNQFETSETYDRMVSKKRSGFATAGLVLGIIGICTSFIPIVNNASFVLGILAVIFGLIAFIKKASFAKVIIAVVLGILAVVITLVMQASWSKAIDDAFDDFNEDMDYLTGDNTGDILKNYLNVEIGSFNVVEDEYWDETELSVTLKNKGSERKSFNVTIEAVDKNGNRITTDTAYVSELGAGQSQKTKLFEYVSSEQIDDLKKATFRVVEASMY